MPVSVIFGVRISASVSLAITHGLAEKLRNKELRLLLAGFGVGWSWESVASKCGFMVITRNNYGSLNHLAVEQAED